MAVHTKVRAYKCLISRKDFLKKRTPTDHIKTHLNIRNRICITYGKGSSHTDALRRHHQIHSDIKHYPCKCVM